MTHAVVHLDGGLRGRADRSAIEAGSGVVEVALDDGRALEAPASAFLIRQDGAYSLPVALGEVHAAAGAASGAAADEVVVPVVAEEAVVTKRQVETGTVRVRKAVRERVETVDVPLLREDVEVRRVPADRDLDGPAEPRMEGDTLIIPIVEEVLEVRKRLRLREELHVTRRRTEVREPREVTLRAEEARVERVPGPVGDAPTA